MKVGDLVRVQNSVYNRIGLVISKAAQKDCFVVRFHDSKNPIQSAYHSSVLRRVNESR